ncbi:hypothetical protein niasHT_009070 [Heterodera trifolii]|uniref:Uncharacterized protein n=1 Tax=Heterodera trifolii TaxID=157864 RepID=A0ABD2MAG9_9BILA
MNANASIAVIFGVLRSRRITAFSTSRGQQSISAQFFVAASIGGVELVDKNAIQWWKRMAFWRNTAVILLILLLGLHFVV